MLKALQRNRTAKDTKSPKNRPGSLQAVLGDFIFHKDQGIAITFFPLMAVGCKVGVSFYSQVSLDD